MFLTDDELRQLTGLKRPTAQARFLASKGIPHFVNAAGRVVVTRAAVETPSTQVRREPKWEALSG
jgi:hypothetical protein